MFENIYFLREKYGYEELILKYSKLWNIVNCKNIPYKIVYIPEPKTGISFSLVQDNFGFIDDTIESIVSGSSDLNFENEVFNEKKKNMFFNTEIEGVRAEKAFIETQLIENILTGLDETTFIDLSNLDFLIINGVNKNIHFEDINKIQKTQQFIEFIKKDSMLEKKINELNFLKELGIESSSERKIKEFDELLKLNYEVNLRGVQLEKEVFNQNEERKLNIFENNFNTEKDKKNEIFMEEEKKIKTQERKIDLLNNFVDLIKEQNILVQLEDVNRLNSHISKNIILEGKDLLISTDKEKIKNLKIEQEQMIGDLSRTYKVFIEKGETSGKVLDKLVNFEKELTMKREVFALRVVENIESLINILKEVKLEDIQTLEKEKIKVLVEQSEKQFFRAEKNVSLGYDFLVEKVKQELCLDGKEFFAEKKNEELFKEIDYMIENIEKEINLEEEVLSVLRDNIKRAIIEQTEILESNMDDFEVLLKITEDLINEGIKEGREEDIIRGDKDGVIENNFEEEYFVERETKKETKIEDTIKEEKKDGFNISELSEERFLKNQREVSKVEILEEIVSNSTTKNNIDISNFELKGKLEEKLINLEKENMIRKKEYEKIKEEIEERLNLHGRFWMFRSYGEKDKINVPNNDFNYLLLPLYFSQTDDMIKYKYKIEYPSPQENLKLMFYIRDKYYELVIEEKNKVETENYLILFEEDKLIFYHNDVEYLFIKTRSSYVIANFEKNMISQNPFEGEFIGIRDIEISMNIIIDFINIYLLVWAKFYESYGGMTGAQSLKKFLSIFYEWVTLDGMSQEPLLEEYQRVYRWIRWEAEKIFLEARHDIRLNGNFYIDKLLYQLLYYLEIHHFDNISIYNRVDKMDEFFEMLETENLNIVTTKFKTIHDRIKEDL